MTVLITGGTGKLGRELQKRFPDCESPVHDELDIRDYESVAKLILKVHPKLLVHTAALTGIRECEENKGLAWETNVQGTENLIRACSKYCKDTYFIHISTACVFYGDRGDYVETDIPHPKNYYSLTKLVAESVVRNSPMTSSLIVRTNFVARETWPYSSAFVDRFGTYLFADDLASAIQTVARQNLTGTVHICGKNKLSMYDLARITTPDIRPMTLDQYKGPPVTIDMSLRSNIIQPFEITFKPHITLEAV